MRPRPRDQLAAVSVVVTLTALSGVAACSAKPAAGPAGTPAVRGTAIVVPGVPAHSKRTYAAVSSVSCSSPGNCAATGYYSHGGKVLAFVASERDGSWEPATLIRGMPARRIVAGVYPTAISCASPGNCTVVGAAGQQGVHPEGFAVSEVNGTWRNARLIPGVAVLDLVSCAGPADCSAAGYHTGAGIGPYVVSEVHGVWGRAAALPHASLLYHSVGDHAMTSLSCASPGNCAAAGAYQDPSSLRGRAYVVSQVHGVWRPPVRVAGLPALNAGGASFVNSVSCASPGNCVAGGAYEAWRQGWQPFVISEVNGAWGAATPVLGLSRNPHAPYAPGGPLLSEVTSVSCPSAGNCTAAGTAVGFGSDGFVAREVNGAWGRAMALRTPATPRRNPWIMQTILLSCATPGTCAVAGYYGNPYNFNPYVATEVNGTWGTARADPKVPPFTDGKQVQFAALSCVPGGGCLAGGSFGTGVDIPGQQDTEYSQAFLLTIG